MFTRTDGPKPAAGSPEAVASTRLGVILAGKTHEVVRELELPRIGKVAIRLLRRTEAEDVDLEVTSWLVRQAKERGVSADELMAAGTLPLSSRTALEKLARALRDPTDHAKPLGTVEELEQLDEEILGEAWVAYESLRLDLDPLSGELSPEELEAIVDAGKKNDRIRLFGFGFSKLCASLPALVARLSS